MSYKYFYLIGNVLDGISYDKCIYLDGVDKKVNFVKMANVVSEIFHQFGFKIEQILIDNFETDRTKKFRIEDLSKLSLSEARNIVENNTIQFFPSKRLTVDETWRPEIYFVVTSGYKSNSIFFSVNNDLLEEEMLTIFKKIETTVEYCAAYFFDFPKIFSSLAYFSRISISMQDKNYGEFGDREVKRLEFHRDNTVIGITMDGEKKFYKACDGYIRDVYPMMILSENHMFRRINGGSLLDFLKTTPEVKITQMGKKFLLNIHPSKLTKIQKIFDDNRITLSGARLD